MSDRAPRRPASRQGRGPRINTTATATTAVLAAPGAPESRPSHGVAMARWNAPRAWKWIAGHWASRFELPVLGQAAGRSSTGRPGPRLTTQSVDEWTVHAGGVRILALSGPAPGLSAAVDLSIGFDPSGRPTLAMASRSGPASVLVAIAATGRSITFQGELTPADADRPLRVTIEHVGKAGLRIVAGWSDAPSSSPLFSYSARKLIDGQAA